MSTGIGDQVRIKATFRVETVETDPTTVTLKLRTPAGTETSHVYGTDANVIRDGLGQYRYDLTLTAAGTYRYRWVGTGAVIAAEESTIVSEASGFSAP